MDTRRKLIILADAAKYDASCASSGTTARDSSDGLGIGSTEGLGICHSCAPDGRCISLLKVLLTDWCVPATKLRPVMALPQRWPRGVDGARPRGPRRPPARSARPVRAELRA